MKKQTIILIFTIPLLVLSILINAATFVKASEAYQNGRRDMYHEVHGAVMTAEDALEEVKPPKRTEYAKQEFNSKGEPHPRLIVSYGLEDFVYNNCSDDVYDVMADTIDYAKEKGIAPQIVYAIAWADTQCGKALTTPFNYGNVANNDRGNRVGYFTPQDGMRAIVDTLNNKYLYGLTKVGQLSQGGRIAIDAKYSCSDAPAPFKCWASSEENWNRNALFALNQMAAGNEVTVNTQFRY